MTLWWEGLSGLQQIFAIVAIPATIVLVIQNLMMLVGFASDSDTDLSGGIDSGLRIFTVKAFVAFFSVFGWLGLVLTRDNMFMPIPIVIAMASGAGFLAMVSMAYFLKYSKLLQSSGNVDMKNALGKTATVYLPIPPNREGKGKVTVVVQGRLTEYDAVTDSTYKLKTNVEATIISITDQGVLCVAPKDDSVPVSNGKPPSTAAFDSRAN